MALQQHGRINQPSILRLKLIELMNGIFVERTSSKTSYPISYNQLREICLVTCFIAWLLAALSGTRQRHPSATKSVKALSNIVSLNLTRQRIALV